MEGGRGEWTHSASARHSASSLARPMGSMNGLESHSTSTPKNAATLPRFNCETYVRSRCDSERGKTCCDLRLEREEGREGGRRRYICHICFSRNLCCFACEIRMKRARRDIRVVILMLRQSCPTVGGICSFLKVVEDTDLTY